MPGVRRGLLLSPSSAVHHQSGLERPQVEAPAVLSHPQGHERERSGHPGLQGESVYQPELSLTCLQSKKVHQSEVR